MPRLAWAVLALLLVSRRGLCYEWQWRTGRATAFGQDQAERSYCPPDQHDQNCWSIHQGNCGFGYIFSNEPCGWDVAAISDRALDFAGSCGRCIEIKCNPATVTDGYGATFDCSAACYDPSASVVVRVVDSCPCNYPNNYFSNARWCCNDHGYYHMDISIWAFEKLADKKWGVIGLLYRDVPCSYAPARAAKPIANPTPGQPAPAGAVDPAQYLGMNTAPAKRWNAQQSTYQYQDAGTPAPAPGVVFSQGLQNGWYDRSWTARPNWSAGAFGPGQQLVACADIYPNGAFSVGHAPGAFAGKTRLELVVKTDQGTPNLALNIGSDKVTCTPINLQSLRALDTSSGWSRFQVTLTQFAGGGGAGGGGSFNGCGGLGFWDVTAILLRNGGSAQQMVCVSSVQLLS